MACMSFTQPTYSVVIARVEVNIGSERHICFQVSQIGNPQAMTQNGVATLRHIIPTTTTNENMFSHAVCAISASDMHDVCQDSLARVHIAYFLKKGFLSHQLQHFVLVFLTHRLCNEPRAVKRRETAHAWNPPSKRMFLTNLFKLC